ncbi:MAG: phytanoyl-CoA dioxygenase family protein [Planctomycetota bacterium]|nr:phytanoyl-CoA dioxygenase family protein [Planctomycetota bacterium]
MTPQAPSLSGSLTPAQVASFADQGFLLVRGVLDPATLAGLRAVFEQAVEQQAQEWFAKGMIKDRCSGASFETRYGLLRDQLPATYSNSWRRIIASPAVYKIWQHSAMVGMMRTLVGDELWASRTWNGRPRAPRQTKQTIDWHQDAHYSPNYVPGIDTPQISVWMPLVPVDENSGCLQVARGSHKQGYRPMVTVERNGLVGLGPEDLRDIDPVSCVMQPGDVLMFNELTYHRSLDNTSDLVRWSLDIRFFDARNAELRGRSKGGYYCFSKADPSRVESYEKWAAQYEYEGEF